MSMHKLSSMILAAALFALAAPLSAYGGFIPPNLPVGSKYEIAFVTRTPTTATSPYIADYNAFVTLQAQQNSNLPHGGGITWHAIASTWENGNIQGANQNAPFTSSIPVYNTQGQLVANAATPLYNVSGTILNPISYDQFGNSDISYVWTGTYYDGTPDNPLGNGIYFGPPDIGISNITSFWLAGGTDIATNVHPLYALSSPITVPEPGTLALLAAGLLVVLRFGSMAKSVVHNKNGADQQLGVGQ